MPQAINQSRTWTILSLLTWAAAYFKNHDIDSPRATAEILLAHALQRSRLDLYLNYDKPMMAEELAVFKTLIKRRVAREPVAYIVGAKEFYALDFKVSPDVLIPRPDTECLVERVLERMAPFDPARPAKILDVGTGTGAIIISLAKARPEQAFFASDLSPAAIRVASANAAQHGVAEQVRFWVGDYLSAVSGPFSLIVSNPPYVRQGDIDTLQPEIRAFEPRLALDGGQDGLAAYRRLIQDAPSRLMPGGILALEIGWDQKGAIQALVEKDGRYGSCDFYKDYADHDRVACLTVK